MPKRLTLKLNKSAEKRFQNMIRMYGAKSEGDMVRMAFALADLCRKAEIDDKAELRLVYPDGSSRRIVLEWQDEGETLPDNAVPLRPAD